MAPYPLDHCVLPTATLEAARARLAGLGFTVAPDAAHPFGTANCCVFFQDGTYLEPLAVTDEQAAREAMEHGNTFVARDRLFRDAFGEEGWSALVLRTPDAAADHAQLLSQGISAGPELSFSRPFVDALGGRDEASFRLAFAAPPGGGSFFFTCERVKIPAVDRSSLQRHDNGALGIARIVAAARDPSVYRAFLSAFLGAPGSGHAGKVHFPLPNTVVSLLAFEESQQAYGIHAGLLSGLQLGGIVFRVSDLARLEKRLVIADIAFAAHKGRIVVPPVPGQGAAFLFEELEG